MHLEVEGLGLQDGETGDDPVGVEVAHGRDGVVDGGGVFVGVGDEGGIGVAEDVVEAADPVRAGEVDAQAFEGVDRAGEDDVQFGVPFEEVFAEEDVGAAGGRGVAEARVELVELGADGRADLGFARGGKAGAGAARLVEHVPGEDDDGGKLEAAVEPLLAFFAAAEGLAHALLDRGEIIPAGARHFGLAGGEADDFAGLAAHRGEVAPAALEEGGGLTVVVGGGGGGALVREGLGQGGEQPAVGGVFMQGDLGLAAEGDFAGDGGGLFRVAGGGVGEGEVDAWIRAFGEGEGFPVVFAGELERLGGGGGIAGAAPEFLVDAAEQTERFFVAGGFLEHLVEHGAGAVERAGLREGEGELLLEDGVDAVAAEALAGDFDGGEQVAGGDGLAGGLLVFQDVVRQRGPGLGFVVGPGLGLVGGPGFVVHRTGSVGRNCAASILRGRVGVSFSGAGGAEGGARSARAGLRGGGGEGRVLAVAGEWPARQEPRISGQRIDARARRA